MLFQMDLDAPLIQIWAHTTLSLPPWCIQLLTRIPVLPLCIFSLCNLRLGTRFEYHKQEVVSHSTRQPIGRCALSPITQLTNMSGLRAFPYCCRQPQVSPYAESFHPFWCQTKWHLIFWYPGRRSPSCLFHFSNTGREFFISLQMASHHSVFPLALSFANASSTDFGICIPYLWVCYQYFNFTFVRTRSRFFRRVGTTTWTLPRHQYD